MNGAPTDISDNNLTAPKPLEKRRHVRKPLRAKATISVGRWPRRRRVEGVIQDISEAGLGIEMNAITHDVANEPVVISWEIPTQTMRSLHSKRMVVKGTMVQGEVISPIQHYGVRLERTVDEQILHRSVRGKKMATVAAATILGVGILGLKARNIISFWYDPLIQVYSIGAAIYVVSRVVLSTFYKPSPDRGLFKTVSIIVAVKNEQDRIAQTITHLFKSHYPKHLIDVMVVDDGSTDGTWAVLQGLTLIHPQLRLFQFSENRGKRHAMALGAREATGEILIYLDSDSFVDPEGIYRLVQPFADNSVGAVAGHTLMIVENDNFISKMECVRYFVSQRVMKAAESIFGAVTCCPGPFSAYRREAVLKILEPWLHQSFLGTAATFGDDRSLTNFILRRYRVLYESEARCSTYAPDKWKGFIKQQLRWKKSWVRETTIAVRRMYREHPIAAISYYFSIIITLVSPVIVLRAFFFSPFILQTHAYLPYLSGLVLVFLFLGLVHYYHTQSPYWYYGTVFALLYCCFFCLQNYYAILTVRRNHWGTR